MPDIRAYVRLAADNCDNVIHNDTTDPNIQPLSSHHPPSNPDIDIPFPKHIHVALVGEEIERRPLFVIGDIHGCLDELEELVALVRSKAPNCIFLFCGDLMDKGPKSVETIRYVRGMGRDAYMVRGNHEDHTLDRWMKWDQSGGQVKPKNKFAWNVELTKEDAEWLMELPYTISVPHTNSVIVHAGLVPGRPIIEQHPWDMTEMCDIVGNTTSKALVGTAWASLWNGPQHIYYGHDSDRGLQEHPFATCLDTACVKGGALTGQFLTGDKERLQVQAKDAYKKKKAK